MYMYINMNICACIYICMHTKCKLLRPMYHRWTNSIHPNMYVRAQKNTFLKYMYARIYNDFIGIRINFPPIQCQSSAPMAGIHMCICVRAEIHVCACVCACEFAFACVYVCECVCASMCVCEWQRPQSPSFSLFLSRSLSLALSRSLSLSLSRTLSRPLARSLPLSTNGQSAMWRLSSLSPSLILSLPLTLFSLSLSHSLSFGDVERWGAGVEYHFQKN